MLPVTINPRRKALVYTKCSIPNFGTCPQKQPKTVDFAKFRILSKLRAFLRSLWLGVSSGI